MEKEQKKEETVHNILAYSYFNYFTGFVLGLLIDLFFKLRIIPQYLTYLGLPIMILASLLILWAQKTSSKLKKTKETVNVEDFKNGPYRFSRSPTNIGLMFLILGFGVLTNSIILVATIIIFSVISHKVFIQKEEQILEKMYGEQYSLYKKSVKSWWI